MSARQQKGELIQIAARLARCEALRALEHLSESGTGNVIGRQRLLDALETAEDQLKNVGVAVRNVADSLPLPETAPADGWIRVEDGLPAIGDDVLVGNSLGQVTTGYRQTEVDAEILAGGTHKGDWLSSIRGITHWRAKPAPPVVEGKP